nr:reverse transcriptase domain-containing protein [Tanacetum cinerariifolium]
MVKEGIVLGHKVSEAGLEVDKAKIDIIFKLPPPTNIKEKVQKMLPPTTYLRLKMMKQSDDSEVNDNFPGGTLMKINTRDEPWCMLAIFHDMIKEFVKVFMEDFSVFGNSFDNCLNNLDKMLQCCKDAHLVLNWEKCHFMVKEGIVLGHKVSEAGLEVDKAKIDIIFKLPP